MSQPYNIREESKEFIENQYVREIHIFEDKEESGKVQIVTLEGKNIKVSWSVAQGGL